MESTKDHREVTLGAAAAAIFAASIGCLTIGIATLLAGKFGWIQTALTWSAPVGPLSGEAGIGVIIWIISWIILHFSMRKKEPALAFVLIASFFFIALSFVLLFPPVFKS